MSNRIDRSFFHALLNFELLSYFTNMSNCFVGLALGYLALARLVGQFIFGEFVVSFVDLSHGLIILVKVGDDLAASHLPRMILSNQFCYFVERVQNDFPVCIVIWLLIAGGWWHASRRLMVRLRPIHPSIKFKELNKEIFFTVIF